MLYHDREGHPDLYQENHEHLDDAPLYLDCCGLVRQAVSDLADDFGFKLGRWNQAYQFDTLPDRKEGVHELSPRDLIFYEATFKDPTANKPQKHNMVH